MAYNEHEFNSQALFIGEIFDNLEGLVGLHAGAYDTAYGNMKQTLSQYEARMAFLTSSFISFVTAGTAGFFGSTFAGFLGKFSLKQPVVDGLVDAKKQAVALGITTVATFNISAPGQADLIAPFQFYVRSISRLKFERADVMRFYRKTFENPRIAKESPKTVAAALLRATIKGEKIPLPKLVNERKLRPDQDKLAKDYEKYLWYNYCQSLPPRDSDYSVAKFGVHNYTSPSTGVFGYGGDLPRECRNRILELGVPKNDLENVYMPKYEQRTGKKIMNDASRRFSFK